MSKGTVLVAGIATIYAIMLTSYGHSKSIAAEERHLNRAKREMSRWDLIGPYLIQQQCFARPCRRDADCCPGYACTGLREIDRRTPLRSCSLSMEELENLL